METFAARVRRMDLLSAFDALTWIDAAVVTALLVLWQGLSWWIEHPSAKHPSVTVLMSEYRRDWMQVMVTRVPRIFDAQLMMSLRQSTSFFASTCLLAIGALLALIGNVEPLLGVAEGISRMDTPAVAVQLTPRAAKAAELNIRAAMNFNRGLRSMYFALGSVAWLAGPWLLCVTVVLTVWLVWSREFASIPRSIILETHTK